MATISRGIRLISVVSLVGLIPLVSGCGLLKKKDDTADAAAEAAVAEVAEAAPPPAATPAAANENDVSRFPDEKKLENVTATLLRPTNVREIPGIGKVVASLTKGGTVTEIAQRSTFFLVVFTNPADQKSLMGWVSQDSFTAPVVPKPIACVLPESTLIQVTTPVQDPPFCGKICVNDVDCPTGQACKGNANKFVNGKTSDAVRVCTIFTVPTAAAATATAAAVATAGPAGGPKPFAIAPLAAQPANVGVVAPGKLSACPVDFVIMNGQCHRKCALAGGGGCPAAASKCVACGASGNVCAVAAACN
jgi:hypothetical protein